MGTPSSVVVLDGPRDVRDLLGLRRPEAMAVLGIYLTALCVTVITSAPLVTNAWGIVTGTLIFVSASIAVIRAPGDPLPITTTWLLTAAGPLGAALILSAIPASAAATGLVSMTHGAAAAVYVFMGVRGRVLIPWIGLVCVVLLFALWGTATGQSAVAAAGLALVDAAPMALGGLFAFTLRPTTSQVFELRDQTTRQVAALAADAAARDERNRQVRHLDQLARPLLERIASGDELTADERVGCAVLEAHLRDRLRAPLMSELDLDNPVFRARKRGVDVVLIDDSGATGTVDPVVAHSVTRLATDVLDHAQDGEVFVRITPPERATAASVLHRTDHTSKRWEINRNGAVASVG